MSSVNYTDLDRTPKAVSDTIKTVASNAAHLAKLLKQHPYPAPLVVPRAGRAMQVRLSETLLQAGPPGKRDGRWWMVEGIGGATWS